jgi:hypothetical protein
MTEITEIWFYNVFKSHYNTLPENNKDRKIYSKLVKYEEVC